MPESPEEHDIVPDDPSIPDEYPDGEEGAEPEVHDQPLGTQRDDDGEGRRMPGVPQGKEPPDAG
jgi:hypothetical protein